MRIKGLLFFCFFILVVGFALKVFRDQAAQPAVEHPRRPMSQPEVNDKVRIVPQTFHRQPERIEEVEPEVVQARVVPPAEIVGTLSLHPGPGTYADPVSVRAVGSAPEPLAVRYTTDGSEPTAESPPWTEPLRFERSTAVRAAGFRSDVRSTAIVAASYFIGPPAGLPVLSIAMAPEDFEEVHTRAHARGKVSERLAHLDVFDAEGRVLASTGFGLRLHGGAGRRGGLNTKKSYKACFRSTLGDGKLRCALIPGAGVKEFDSLVLRANYNDRFRPGRGDYNRRAAYVRDEVIRDLHRDMGALSSAGAWCLLYVNMEPKGLYNVVERLDEDFLRQHLGGKAWDVVKTGEEVVCGTGEEWDRLRDFVYRSELHRDEAYREAGRLVDMENFTGYVLLQLWAQNEDWPHNNWCAARPRKKDGRWVFLTWDTEWGLGLNPGGHQAASFDALLHRRGGVIRDLFQGLLASETYRTYLRKEIEDHLAGALRPERVLEHIEREARTIRPFMEEELAAFTDGFGMSDWERNLETVRRFARGRGEFFGELAREW